MSFNKAIQAIAITVLFGAMPLPAWSAMSAPQTPNSQISNQLENSYQSPQVDARQEFLNLNQEVARDLDHAWLSSNFNPTAESEYVASQHAFRDTDYIAAVKHLKQADSAVKGAPNQPALN